MRVVILDRPNEQEFDAAIETAKTMALDMTAKHCAGKEADVALLSAIFLLSIILENHPPKYQRNFIKELPKIMGVHGVAKRRKKEALQ